MRSTEGLFDSSIHKRSLHLKDGKQALEPVRCSLYAPSKFDKTAPKSGSLIALINEVERMTQANVMTNSFYGPKKEDAVFFGAVCISGGSM